MNLPYLRLFPLHQLLQDLLLTADNGGKLHIHDFRIQLTSHQGSSLVILYYFILVISVLYIPAEIIH